jgi:hypothetical protein
MLPLLFSVFLVMSLQMLFQNYLQDIVLSLWQISLQISAQISKEGLTVPAIPAPPEFHVKRSDIVFNALLSLDGKLPFSVYKTLAYSLTKGIFYCPCFII